MGTHLRKMYGDQMVNFGFAFNEGSFQAVEQGRSLRNFTVQPMPAGSFDATLAATGIPIYALDLKHAPGSGPVAGWLRGPLKHRSVGAVFSEDLAANYQVDLLPRAAFDAILFVEKTSAAIPNPPLKNAVVTCDTDTGPALCHDNQYKVAFRLPEGWSMGTTWRWGDRQNTVQFNDPQRDRSVPSWPALYYQVREEPSQQTPEEIARDLRQEVQTKVRGRIEAGIADYHLRPDSCQPRTVNGHIALSCIGELTSPGGKPLVEYLTFIKTQRATALFFGYLPADALDSFRKRLDAVIETLQIP